MSDRWDICTGREGRDGKRRWTKIGVMFPSKEGNGFTIKLDALPLPNKDGEVWCSAFVPREPEAQSGEARYRETGSGMPQAPRSAPAIDDDIPF